MAKPDDIEATEKLLRLIRQGQNSQEENPPKHGTTEDVAASLMMEESFSPPAHAGQRTKSMARAMQPRKLELELERTGESSTQPTPLEYETIVTEEEASDDEFFVEPAEEETPGPTSSVPPTQSPPQKISPRQRLKLLFAAVGQRLNPRPATVVIGIDIQPDAVNFAKVNRSGGKPKLVDCLRIPFLGQIGAEVGDRQISFQLLRNVPWFRDVFHNALTELCPPDVSYEIWCTIANNFIETHSITLPKLAPREIANAVYWSAKKKTDFDDKQVIFDYSVLGEILLKGQIRISSVVYLASRAEIDAIAGFFSSLGHPLTGVTTHSIAIQNQLRDDSVTAPDEAVSHLHLGDQQSFIDVFTSGQLAFRRDIKTGLNSFTDPIFELALEQNLTIDESVARAMIFQEDLSILHQNPYFRPMLKITDGELVLDLPALGRLVRQLQRTFSYCATNFNVSKMSRILISGLPGASARFVRQMEQEVGIRCTHLDPFQDVMLLDEGLAPDRKDCLKFLVSALGLTLSDALKTQNFLCTYQEKEKKRAVGKSNRVISIISSVIFLVLIGIYAWEQFLVHSVSNKLEALRKEIAVTASGSSTDTLKTQIMKKIRDARDAQRDYQQKSARFLHMALAREYSMVGVSQVKFTKVSVAAIQEETAQKKDKTKDKEKAQKSNKAAAAKPGAPPKAPKGNNAAETTGTGGKHKVTMEGLIFAEDRLLDFVLADLLQKMAAISYSSEYPIIDSKVIEKHANGNVLHFVVSVVASPFNKKELSSTHGGEAGS